MLNKKKVTNANNRGTNDEWFFIILHAMITMQIKFNKNYNFLVNQDVIKL